MAGMKIAVVGFAARLPGGPLEELWTNLCAGRDLVSTIPPDRWNLRDYWHPDSHHAGSCYTLRAGTIGDIGGFDAGFFGISPREAEQLDPQQRILLELAWEAFEDAGIPPSSVRGRAGGVFVGFSGSDWSYRRADDLASFDANSMTGQTGSVAANRISYQFDLRGPSLAIDTACSSSLVAFHQACVSIASGESEFAVAGGITLHLHPLAFVGFARASMLSPRGVCNVFDAAGDGYVRSEGGGLFLLKPLERAVADGDRIHAVVAASGVNCDGRTQGITVPGADTQGELLRQVYARAGIAPVEIDYVEAHGTGTAVGDPIECRSLAEQLGTKRPRGRPLPIGSVKSNLGHLETASGVAGLAKAILCLRHRAVPPTIGITRLNPAIPFADWNLAAVTETLPLDPARPLTIGVNSFGFGGANAHVVLQSPPPDAPEAREARDVEPAPQTTVPLPPLLLSGRGPSAVATLAAQMADRLAGLEPAAYRALAGSAALHRDWLESRAVAFGADVPAIRAALLEIASGAEARLAAVGDALALARGPVFVYSGNGAQWAGMGRQLLQQSRRFAEVLAEVDAVFMTFGTFSLVDTLLADDIETRLQATEIAQPLLFAIQVGLTRLLAEAGCRPAAVVGHSVGEVAAAWACGALTLHQAVQVIFERSVHQGATRGQGGMTAVGLSEADVLALLAELAVGGTVVVAGVNSPKGVTLAGPVDALATVEAALNRREVFCRRLALDYAFHSPAMDVLEQPLQRDLATLSPAHGDVPFYSTVTGGRLDGARLDSGYWWRNVRLPVLFAGALGTLLDDGFNVFVEIGPHAILRTYIHDCLRDRSANGRVIATLRRGDEDLADVLRARYLALIAGVAGQPADLFPRPAARVDLPRYPWQRERFWHPDSGEGYQPITRPSGHRLLGHRLLENPGQWEILVDLALLPELADHAVGGSAVMPAAGYVEMALAASRAWYGPNGAEDLSPPMPLPTEIEELEITSPLLLERAHSRKLRFTIDPSDGRFAIASRPYLEASDWQVHVTGRLTSPGGGAPLVPRLALPTATPSIDGATHYALAERVGLDYGQTYRVVDRVWVQPGEAIAALVAATGEADADYHLPPARLDGGFQLLVDILREEIAANGGAAFIPVRIGRLRLWDSAAVSHVSARVRRRGPRSIVADFGLYAADGRCVAEAREVRFRAAMLTRRIVDHTGYLRFRAVAQPLRVQRDSIVAPDFDPAAACREVLHARTRLATRQPYYDEIEPLLDVLCAAFAKEAVDAIAGGEAALDPESLLAGAVDPRFTRCFTELVAILAEDGLVEADGERLVWTGEQSLPPAAEIWTSLLGDYPDYAAEILMIGRVGQHLADVVRGRIVVEDLVPADPEHPLLSHYLEVSPSLLPGNRALARLVETVAAQLTPGQRLRILDFTLGNSRAAAQVLPSIDFDRCDYVLGSTDAGVLEGQGLLVERYPRLGTLLLDGHSDGAAATGFDLVLVSHELRHGAHPERLLALLGDRLLPGGVLALVEQPATRWQRLVFGLRDDWWEVAEARDLPRARAAMDWLPLLKRVGLTDAAVIPDLPGQDDGPYLVIARSSRAHAAVDDALRAPPGCWLILHDGAGPGQVLAELLAAGLRPAGIQTCLASVGDAVVFDGAGDVGGEALAFDRYLGALCDQKGPPQGIVMMHGLPFGPTSAGAAARRCIDAATLTSACVALSLETTVMVVTSGATADLVPGPPAAPLDDAALWGFVRTLMNECDGLSIRLVELADPHDPEATSAALVDEICNPDAEDEVIYAASGRYCPRLHTVPPAALLGSETSPDEERLAARLEFDTPGPLKHLRWRRRALPALGHDDVEIEVRAAGLNFRDVMYAMGLLSDEAVEAGFSGPTLGMELAGVIRRVGDGVRDLAPGDAVIAFAPSSFAERVITRAGAVARKPADWSFNAAATVPTTFFTAYYALYHLAQLEEGERLLIHGAAGGVGLAAIQLARARGAEVFATAGTPMKRDVVRLLGADHVLDSRSLAFADEILALTGGEGVDVVLNSLAGEAINRNLRILRPFGRFLELGKRDFYENTRIGLRPFRNNIAYFGIDADQLMHARPALTQRLFGELMGLFHAGGLKPLPYRMFPAAQVVEAFRYMQQSRQIGKVVLNFEDGVGEIERPPPRSLPLRLRADATYLVTGGMRGFGLATAVWMADRGARQLVLLSRRGAADDEGAATIEALQGRGVRVRAEACDVTDAGQLARLLDDIERTLPPLRGVVHAAMVIDDGLVRNLDADRIRGVLAPKIDGARHLDRLTRNRELDFFVLYSSATTLFGNPGQASYVAANRFLEILAHARRRAGLPATCVSWGAIDDVGYLARNARVKEQLQSRLGGAALHSVEALAALEQLLTHDLSGVGVMELDWATLQRSLPSSMSPKYRDLVREAEDGNADAEDAEQLRRWLESLDDAELVDVLRDLLAKEIGDILHVPPDRLDGQRPLQEIGMDSLMGMELVAAVENRFGVTLPLMALSEGLTVERLVQMMLRQLRAPDDHDPDQASVERVVAQHGGGMDTDQVEDMARSLGEHRASTRSLMDD